MSVDRPHISRHEHCFHDTEKRKAGLRVFQCCVCGVLTRVEHGKGPVNRCTTPGEYWVEPGQ